MSYLAYKPIAIFQALVKAATGSDYPHFDELKQGLDAAKRITDRINEAQRRQENVQTVKSLEARVEDWKGHHLSNFGELILDDIFMVMKMEIDREYHVFLFEKIILCCKELLPQTPGSGNRKNGKSNSIIKKQNQFNSASLPGGVGPPRKKTTPLLLKGRIFLNNVTHTVPSNHMGACYALLCLLRPHTHSVLFQATTRSKFGGEAMTITNTSRCGAGRKSN